LTLGQIAELLDVKQLVSVVADEGIRRRGFSRGLRA